MTKQFFVCTLILLARNITSRRIAGWNLDCESYRARKPLCTNPSIDGLRPVAAMKRLAGRIKATVLGAQITEGVTENTVVKLTVRSQGVQIKIEVTPVLRGCVFKPEIISVKPAVQEEFGFAEARIVSFEDLYAGKIVVLDVPGTSELPAVKWRQQNLDKLSKDKRAALVARLEEVLSETT